MFYLQGNFANPVYESMYADAIAEPASVEIALRTAPDERKGLLQHTHDETHTPDILWWLDRVHGQHRELC